MLAQRTRRERAADIGEPVDRDRYGAQGGGGGDPIWASTEFGAIGPQISVQGGEMRSDEAELVTAGKKPRKMSV
jgi:hypothetical protein